MTFSTTANLNGFTFNIRHRYRGAQYVDQSIASVVWVNCMTPPPPPQSIKKVWAPLL